MEESPRDGQLPALGDTITRFRNTRTHTQEEDSKHITYYRLETSDPLLSALFCGVALFGVLTVLVVILWWRNQWRTKHDTMDSVPDPPKIAEEELIVRYVEETETVNPKIETTRNYGGSSPKVPEEEEKFVYPEKPGTSAEVDQSKLKIPLREHSFIKKPFDTPYRVTIPRHLTDVNTDLKDDVNERRKKYSATRSPSLENDKSPFVGAEKNEVFAFEPEKVKDIENPLVFMVQPKSDVTFEIVDANFNNNVTPISPKLMFEKTPTEHLRTSSLDEQNDNKRRTNLRRYRSVNTKLNICSTADVDAQIERSELQNSPRILECSSATEKSTKFNFSPKLLSENQNSPKFFTPTDKFSPRFFPEGSPKSVYYDSVRSPKFFPDTPRSPAAQEERSSLSPKFPSNRNSPKFLDQHSPRILGSTRSPRIYSGNKENYFDFDSSTIQTIDEVENTSVFKKPSYIQRYGGRNSIERERVTQNDMKQDVRRYKRHNSCDTYNRNFDNGNNVNKSETVETETKGEDVTDFRAKEPPADENNTMVNPHTAYHRRQRLKSISLDSDNAKIIEQNLGLPIAKHLKQDNLNEALQDYRSSMGNVKRSGTCDDKTQGKFTFDMSKEETTEFYSEESKYSPEMMQKKNLRDSSDTQSFLDMPRFSPKEFEVIVTIDEDQSQTSPKKKGNKNLRNLTIDLTRRDSDLEKELLEFEKLYSDSGPKKIRTPTLKVKAISLDSSDTINLSLPQKNTLEAPQNSVSVPSTPKKQFKRILPYKHSKACDMQGGGKLGLNSLQAEHRRTMKLQHGLLDSGIFLKENHANLMLFQPGCSRYSRRMGSLDENLSDFAENQSEIKNNECTIVSSVCGDSSQTLGSNLLSFKQNLSVSSTNLKTLPEGVPSNDFEPTVDEKVSKKLNRRGSNQSLKLNLDQAGKYSTYSLQSSNCSLNTGLSCHSLASMRNSASNFSLNTDNRQKVLGRRNSNNSLTLNDHLAPITRIIGASNANLQGSNINLSTEGQVQTKNCLLQRRGSNNSLTLNLQSSNTNLNRFCSNSSLNISKEGKTGQRKGLLERRSSNTSLTLNINTSNPQLTTCRGFSISNYNLNGSNYNLNLNNSNQSINNTTEVKKGILERRSSNTSLTINIQNQDVPRDIEVDEKMLESNLQDQPFTHQRDKHRKSLSTENLIPKSYKTRNQTKNENLAFGSHDELWSNSYVTEALRDNYGQNLTYVCGDPENEIIYAFGARSNVDESQGIVRNITTKPLSPQTTSEDFKTYLANIQLLQNASSVLTRKQLKDINNVFQNGYSKVKCDGPDDNGHRCSPREPTRNPQMSFPETELPCSEYQKSLLRNLHKEFWDLPSNFQEKPMVFGSHQKNRYKTILPNEHSRFILKSDFPDQGESYINANFIKGHEYTKNSFIATQGPLPNTIYDFWLMVHQNRVVTSVEQASAASKRIQKIVMLTNLIEDNRQKCEKYFPMEVGEVIIFENDDTVKETTLKNNFTIKNEGILHRSGYAIRRLSVSYNKSNGSDVFDVYHYWFSNWADHKCPKDVNSLLNLSLDVLDNCLYEFDTNIVCRSDPKYIRDETTKFVFPPNEETVKSCSSPIKPLSAINFEDTDSPPTIVHCSAGIGRTGCLIAILNGIKQLNYDDKVDILGIVCNMRLNRGGMVQNSEQYELIHKVLCLYEQIFLPVSNL